MKWINSTERLPANPNRGNYKLSDVVLVPLLTMTITITNGKRLTVNGQSRKSAQK